MLQHHLQDRGGIAADGPEERPRMGARPRTGARTRLRFLNTDGGGGGDPYIQNAPRRSSPSGSQDAAAS